MNRSALELLINAKEMLELKSLLRTYKKDNPGLEEEAEMIFEYLDTEIVKCLHDVIHLERLD
jgi:hypothetical protein